jgi:hypothetical protein
MISRELHRTDTPAKSPRRILSDAESFKAYGLLSDHLMETVEKGIVSYRDGFTDQKIADMVGCTLANITGLRERAFGRLSKAVETRDPRVDHLIAAHDALVRDITDGTFTVGSAPGPYLVGVGENK